MKNIFNTYKRALPEDFEGYYKGDLLYYTTPPINDDGYFEFTPNIVTYQVKQDSEFEKKEKLDLNEIAALIDKKKENLAETKKEVDKISQSTDETMNYSKLTLNEEDALKAQIFTCWSVPIGLPFSEDLLVRVKLQLKPDGTIEKLEMLDHVKMNLSLIHI